MSAPTFVWPGVWGPTGHKSGIEYVKPIPGASHRWSVKQLLHGPLAKWHDREGVADLEAPVFDSQRPEVYESARKVVRFNGVNQRMDVAHPQPGVSTAIIVGRFASVVPGSSYMITGGSGPAWNLYINGNGFFGFFAGNAIQSSVAGDTSTHVFIVVRDGTNSVLSVDGVEVSGNSGNLVPTTLRLGATSSAYTPVDIEDITFLPYAAGSAERASLLAEAKAQHGL